MKLDKNILIDFSTLFTRSEISRFLNNDFYSINLKLKRYNLNKKYNGKSYLYVLKDFYKQLIQYYPNEYILKNELINQILLNEKEKDKKNTKIFNEFRIGKAIGDITIFNGVSRVYEIKSILDTDFRLNNQINFYSKIFNEIFIVIPFNLINKFSNFDEKIGIILFNQNTGELSIYKKAQHLENIDIDTLMQTIHTKEYIKIATSFYGKLPTMNSFNQFHICKELISKIPIEELNNLYINTIKNRKVNNTLSKKWHNELNQIFLSLNFDEKNKTKLLNNLKTKIS